MDTNRNDCSAPSRGGSGQAQGLQRWKEITVTRTGYRLLLYFLEHQSRVVTRDELLHEVWGYTRSGEDRNLVETAIRRLRKEIEDDPKNPECLHTIWGVGIPLRRA